MDSMPILVDHNSSTHLFQIVCLCEHFYIISLYILIVKYFYNVYNDKVPEWETIEHANEMKGPVV